MHDGRHHVHHVPAIGNIIVLFNPGPDGDEGGQRIAVITREMPAGIIPDLAVAPESAEVDLVQTVILFPGDLDSRSIPVAAELHIAGVPVIFPFVDVFHAIGDVGIRLSFGIPSIPLIGQ